MHKYVYEFVFLVTIVCFLDSLYIYSVNNLFKKMIERIQKTEIKINPFSLVLCYVLICTCIYYFVWKKNASLMESFALGFFVYGIFDSTNYTLFRDWNVYLSIIDSIWGGLLFLMSNFMMNLLF